MFYLGVRLERVYVLCAQYEMLFLFFLGVRLETVNVSHEKYEMLVLIYPVGKGLMYRVHNMRC